MRSVRVFVLAVLGIALNVTASSSAHATGTAATGDTIYVGQSLSVPTPSGAGQVDSQPIRSANGAYQLTLYLNTNASGGGAGGLELDESAVDVSGALWTHTGPLTSQAYAEMQTDGNFVLYTKPGVALWSTHTAGSGTNNRLALRNDGNLVMYTDTGRVVWETHTHQELLGPGQKLTAGQSLSNVYSPSYPSTALTMQADGELVVRYHGAEVWDSNTTVPNSYLEMGADGIATIYSPAGQTLWTSRGPRVSETSQASWLAVDPQGQFEIGFGPGSSGGPMATTVWSSINAPGEFGCTTRGALRLMTQRSILHPGQSLTSINGYRLTMQPDGNLVQRGPNGSVRWQTHTGNHPGAALVFRPDGNIAIELRGVWLWQTRTPYGVNFAMQSNGNEVVRDSNGKAIWASNTAA